MATTKLVPPDGGFAWVIMCALGFANIITTPILQGFGLLFKDRFNELHFSAVDTATIMNGSSAVVMFCGIFTGPLLNRFGSRKVAVIGATIIFFGLILTAYANSYAQYFLTYAVLTSCGLGWTMSAYPLALNMYFKKKRGKAMGYGMTIAGFGPIIMPLIYTLLIRQYGVSDAILIISAISTHAYLSALLLQPVKWHMKKEVIEDVDEDMQPLKDGEPEDRENDTKLEIDSIYSIDPSISGSVVSLYSHNMFQRSRSSASRKMSAQSKYSVEFNENNRYLSEMQTISKLNPNTQQPRSMKQDLHQDISEEEKQPEHKPNVLKRVGMFIINLYDLSLLKDPTYVNIMVGLSCALFAEMNFSLLTPFIMQDFGLNTEQIAIFMSTVSIADVCFRFVAPYVSEFFKQPARIMYLCTLLLLILSRSCLLLTSSYYVLLGCALFLGVAKGFRTVYWSLVIPEYIPIERFASAAGIQGTFNGIVTCIGGAIFGYIRDILGSYKYCIIVINCTTFITVVMWTLELGYKKLMSIREKSGKDEENIDKIEMG